MGVCAEKMSDSLWSWEADHRVLELQDRDGKTIREYASYSADSQARDALLMSKWKEHIIILTNMVADKATVDQFAAFAAETGLHNGMDVVERTPCLLSEERRLLYAVCSFGRSPVV